jgi:hypothetical protein
MLSHDAAPPASAPVTREDRVEGLLARLRGNAEATLRQMAERLADLPEEQSFGQVELDLRDLAHDLASSSHQAALDAGKKRATAAPASPAPTAAATPASSATAPRPG